MKPLLLLFTGMLTATAVSSQQNKSIVTLTVLGNKNLRIAVDDYENNLYNASTSGNKTTLRLSNLDPGQHSLQITRNDAGNYYQERTSTVFYLRTGFDLLIKLNENGSLELTETKKTAGSGGQTPMSNTNFNALLKNVRSQSSVNGRRSIIANAFNNTNNYFTTFQVEQLLQLVNSESYRLQLAKLSYRGITDPENFSLLYDLFNSQASKNELQEYVNDYNDTGTNYGRSPMPDADFNSLHQDIKNQWPVSTQMISLAKAFNDTTNYFTCYQAGQLIQIVSSESNRLHLAKLSYRSITDTGNFNQIYNLLYSLNSRNELAAYVKNYYKSGTGKTPMSDSDFNNLYQTIQLQFFPGEKMTSLTNVFTTAGNYFTCAQAKKLIQLVTFETNRLQLAKLSYKTITDRNNFSQLYDLFTSQSSKNELEAYVKAYKD